MKTDTVNMWTSTNANVDDYIDIDGEEGRICSVYIGEETETELQKQNAALIVAAVNACKEINPDNPLNVASHLVEFVEMYKKLQMELEHFINATPTGDKRVQLTGLNILALWQLNQITE